jgi:hypothetical protein
LGSTDATVEVEARLIAMHPGTWPVFIWWLTERMARSVGLGPQQVLNQPPRGVRASTASLLDQIDPRAGHACATFWRASTPPEPPAR